MYRYRAYFLLGHSLKSKLMVCSINRFLTSSTSRSSLLVESRFSANFFEHRRSFFRIPPPPGKPPNLPPAKTKRYEVINTEWLEPEDVKELLWRRHAYMHALNSIREHFRQEVEAQSKGEGSTLQMLEEENEEFEEILRENDENNQRNAEQRAKREAEELLKLESEALEQMEKYWQRETESIAKKEAEVEKIKAEEPNYVTSENLEQRILQCLEEPIDFAYAVDTEGHYYHTGTRPAKFLTALPGPMQKFRYEETAGVIRRNTELNFLTPDEEDEQEKQSTAS